MNSSWLIEDNSLQVLPFSFTTLFLVLEFKGWRLYVLATEEQNTTSTQLKDLFVKEVDSLVYPVA